MPRPAGPIAAAAPARAAATAVARQPAQQPRQCGACAGHWRGIGASSPDTEPQCGQLPRRGLPAAWAPAPVARCCLETCRRTSLRLRKPSAWMAVWCTKISSLPSSGVMNPKPFCVLNHLTCRPRAVVRRRAAAPASAPRGRGKLSSPNRSRSPRPWRPATPLLAALRRRRAQLGRADPRLPPRAAWLARGASRRGERGPRRGDCPRGRRRDPGGSRTLPIFFASAIAHGSCTDAGTERGLEWLAAPRQQSG